MKKALHLLIPLVCLLVIVACNENDIEFRRSYSNGSLLYQQRCQNCHGNSGEGLSALIPPLTDSVFLRKNSTQLACITKFGTDRILLVGGKTYAGKMPVTGLAPVDIAQVLTYIKNSFGNKQGLVTVEQVNKDLQGCE